jgi:hypothetical protein
VFKNPDGTQFTVTQANGLNQWFWGADIVALILVGLISDRLRVRKPLMLIGTIGSMIMLVVFAEQSYHPHTSYSKLAFLSVLLAISLAVVFAPWMAGYTESVEAKNPALVATGLALWGWTIRVVVGISFIFLPLVINTVNPIVDNLPVASTVIQGQSIADWVATHPDNVAFAEQHATLLKAVSALPPSVQKGLIVLSGPAVAYAAKALGATQFTELTKLATQFKTLVVPYQAQLTYLSDHQATLTKLNTAVQGTAAQWRKWFLVDFIGMIVFLPLIWLTRGRWSPGQAKRDAEEHERRVNEELSRLLSEEKAGAGTA